VNTDYPHILVTNDDGVLAPGLAALAEALKAVGRVSVIAPDRNRSASGHVKTLHRPLRVDETCLANGLPALMTDGAPSDAVALGLMGLVPQPVHLVVAGINRGANVGHDLTYSGLTLPISCSTTGFPPGSCSMSTSQHGPQLTSRVSR